MSAFDLGVCEWLNNTTISQAKKQTVLNRMSVGISNYRTLELDVSHNPPTNTKRSVSYQRVATESVCSPSRTSKRGTSTRSDGASVAQSVRASSKARSTATTTTNITRHTRPTNACSNSNMLAQQPIDVDYALQQRISKAIRRIQGGDEGSPDCLLFPYRQPIVPEDESITVTVRTPTVPVSYASSVKCGAADTMGDKKSSGTLQEKSTYTSDNPVTDTDNCGEGVTLFADVTEIPFDAADVVDDDKLDDVEL